jgi:hypothetical protein
MHVALIKANADRKLRGQSGSVNDLIVEAIDCLLKEEAKKQAEAITS